MPSKTRSREPGKVFPSKYEREVLERQDFRSRMRAELKAMARESFETELERMKYTPGGHSHHHVSGSGGSGSIGVNNNLFDSMENDRTQQLEMEVVRLQQMVDEMRQGGVGMGAAGGTGMSSTMHCSWSSPLARDQSLPLASRTGPLDLSDLRASNGNNASNNMFILSSAPANGTANRIPDEQTASMSLVEQAQRFAEMHSLFQLPTQLPPNDPIYLQQQEWARQQQEERQERVAQTRAQREKLQTTIDSHRGRLEKSRNPPRRFPLEVKPSTQSPRARVSSSRGPTSPSQQPQSPQQHHQQQSQPSGLTLTNIQPFSTIDFSNSAESSPVRAPTASQNMNATVTSSLGEDPLGGSAVVDASPTRKPPTTISLDDFDSKTKTMSDTIKKLIRESVHEGLVADGHHRHYTKRFQKKLLDLRQDPLVDKIEKSLGDKIAVLQKELDELKEQKIRGKRRGGGDDFDDSWVDLLESLNIEGVDGEALSSEINRTVEVALRRFLTGQGPSYERSSAKVISKSIKISDRDADKAQVISRVHGVISSSSYNSDPVRDSVGFDSHDNIPNTYQPSSVPASASAEITTAISSPPSTAVDTSYDEPPVVKPKSKAERLLGVSTDAKSGLPVNDPIASNKQQNGLFGSIGSLFSAKPGSGAGGSSGGLVTGFGMSSRNATSHSSSPAKPYALGPIIDEGQEEQSDRKAKKKPGANGSFSASDGQSSKSNNNSVSVNPALVAEIAQEEVNHKQLLSNLLALNDTKTNLKKEIKDWQIDFQNKFDREPSVEDKAVINDKFVAYKLVCQQAQQAKDLVKISDDKLKELREKNSS